MEMGVSPHHWQANSNIWHKSEKITKTSGYWAAARPLIDSMDLQHWTNHSNFKQQGFNRVFARIWADSTL